MSMRVRAVRDDLGVFVGQQLRGEFLDAFGRDVQSAGNVRFAITFRCEGLDDRDLFLVNFGFQFFSGNCSIHISLLRDHGIGCRVTLYRFAVCRRAGLEGLDFCAVLALDVAQPECRGLATPTNAIPLPKPKPRAVREHFVVPSIGSRDVACAEWPNVRRFEHFLKLLNLVNDAFNVHASQSSKRRRGAVK